MKKHNYKSREEVLHAMIDGKVFFHLGETITFDGTSFSLSSSKIENCTLDQWGDFKIDNEWTDDLVNGAILCEVETDPNCDNIFDMIIDYVPSRFAPYKGRLLDYGNAKPVTMEGIWNGQNIKSGQS